ncbi:PEP-CTERM sorting domain-containing protein [Rugamonas sp. A1-17]|nr:PEP-CTERM sorting domain-containing protein [Rugamonas sp. A1-17]
MVGRADLNNSMTHAFSYTKADGMKDLGTLGGSYNSAVSVNAQGGILGYSTTAAGDKHSFLYSNGTMTDLTVKLMNSSPDWGTVVGLDNLKFGHDGSIVGSVRYDWRPDYGFPMFYLNGLTTPLPAGEEYAGGRSAGGVTIYTGLVPNPYIYLDGDVYTLNSLLAVPQNRAIDFDGNYDINESGQILGRGWDIDRQQGQTYLLTPVPEPETRAMLLAGLGLLGWTKRRRSVA